VLAAWSACPHAHHACVALRLFPSQSTVGEVSAETGIPHTLGLAEWRGVTLGLTEKQLLFPAARQARGGVT